MTIGVDQEAEMERIVRIILEGDVIEEFNFDFGDMSEPEIDQMVIEYVFNNLEVEVI